jgi:hypothetical protein
VALPATLTYNGVDLVIGRVLQCLQEPEYDDLNNALWTNFDLTVRCIINPFATASNTGGFNLKTAPGGGDLPGASIANLRRSLLQPRGYLLVKVGKETVWEAPQTTTAGVLMKCDATGGPTPVAFNVEQIVGTKSVVATYRIRFALNECVARRDHELSTGGSSGLPLPPPILLSHVWDMEETLDEQALSTRVITGEAIFRRDFLERHLPKLTPDDFRSYLYHPIPDYFQRLPVRVKVTRDGQGIQYQLTDVERPWGIDPDAGILRLEGYLERGFDWMGFTNPVAEGVFHAEVWGQPRCKSATLVDALVRLFTTIRGSAGAAMFTLGPYRYPYTAVRVRVDFPGRHASMTHRVRLGGKIFGTASLVVGAGPVDADFPEDLGDLGGPAQPFNPIPANGYMLRGDRLLRLVTQAFSGPCSEPPDPPTPDPPYIATEPEPPDTEDDTTS